MSPNTIGPTVIAIFGASGDLTQRKIIPALYDLFLDKELPQTFQIVGVARSEMSEEDFQKHLREGIQQFARHSQVSEQDWGEFAAHLSYISSQYEDSNNYIPRIIDLAREWQTPANYIFYLAIPPAVFEIVVKAIGGSPVASERERTRIVVEKPFGHDLESAKALNALLTHEFDESQIYRIDHFLGKETVQNILAFRFGNSVWEPIWDRRYIASVQITVAEQIGIGHRGGYYEHAGALRDMVQNHLLQILCLVAMEPPVSFEAAEIRNRKSDVLHAIRPIPERDVAQFAVRGQYGAGWVKGQHVVAYREEPKVAPDSNTETFAALKLYIDNWRWQGVPFYLRTGKRMYDSVSEVSLPFHPVPHQPFRAMTTQAWHSNRLAIQIEPEQGIVLRTQAKEPGSSMILRPIDMHFTYQEVFHKRSPEAYETLLLDVMRGDPTLFMRADQVEAAWGVLMPVLDRWQIESPQNFPNYAAGTWGPEEAVVLLARDERTWLIPVSSAQQEGTRAT